MSPPRDPSTAMVLSGGSVYAAYEVGVMKALLLGHSPATDYQPIDPRIYVGTSAGAINASVLVSEPGSDSASDIAYLESIWLDHLASGQPGQCGEPAVRIRGDLTPYLNRGCLATDPLLPFFRVGEDAATFLQFALASGVGLFSSGSTPLVRRLLQFIDISRLFSLEGFTRVLFQQIKPDRIRTSPKLLRITTTNWRTGELRLFANSDMTDEIGHDIVRASSRFPSLPPVYIEGDPYVDGGYVLNTPLSPAIHAGASELHVVFMDPDIKNLPLRRTENTIDVFDKLYHVTLATIFKRDIEEAKDINRGLQLLEDPADLSTDTNQDARALARAVRMIHDHALAMGTPRLLTIHLYHPRDDIGGILGLMNFDHQHIHDLIQRGFSDAINHNCQESGCILPGGPSGPPPNPIPTTSRGVQVI